jgi:hypothetical protein
MRKVRKPETIRRTSLKPTDILLKCYKCGYPSYADALLFMTSGQQYVVGKCAGCGRKGRHYKVRNSSVRKR